MSEADRAEAIAELSDSQADALLYAWDFWARPDQLLPAGDWQTWLILAGRGFGKTRTGAEVVREWIKRGFRYVNLIGATADDVRDVLVEGESGILAICPRRERPYYRPSKSRLEWPNGARSLLFSADEPERLRGKQHEKLWCDELAAWRYSEAWDQAMMGLRLGDDPQAVVTTTPKPTAIIRELVADPNTHVTRGSTYDNRNNLAPKFFAKVIRKYEGTRLGRQELNAEILDDNPRALFKRSDIERTRVRVAPTLQRIVIGLDPNVKNRDRVELAKSNDVLDEAGIVCAGVAIDSATNVEHYFVIGDHSIDAGPNEWGKAAVLAYALHRADRVIGEVNNGGDMVEMTIRNVEAVDPSGVAHKGSNVSYKAVTASRGKAIRAEPISALYEQGRVHHVGTFAQLEDEMCQFDPITTTKSPNRMDALVWALTELSEAEGMGMLGFMQQWAANSAPVPPVVYATPTVVQGFPG